MITIKYPSFKDRDVSNNKLIRQDFNSHFFVNEIIKDYGGALPEINTIEIETINRCNNDCSFCPVNRNDDVRPYRKMEDGLFFNIIEQLNEMNYQGFLSLFSNNEPLMDVRIFEFLEYAYHRLPNTKHALFTNGILLTKEKYKRLVRFLDYLIIDNYSDDLTLLPNIQEIVDHYSDEETSCKTYVLVRKKNQILSNRGGNAPNREKTITFASACALPYMQFVIRPDGLVSRCCQDAYGKTTMGDLKKDRILDIWSNESYTGFRRELMSQGRRSIEHCKECDLFGITNYFPEYWITKLVQTLVNLVWKQKRKNGKKIFVFDHSRMSKKIEKILSLHGVVIDGRITENEVDELKNGRYFIIFPSYDYEALDVIDPNVEKVGVDYIVFEDYGDYGYIERMDKDDELKDVVHLIKETQRKKVILFGTGYSASQVMDVFAFDVAYYIDNNCSRWGEQFLSRNIHPPDELRKEDKENICVIIASLKYREMKKQLLEKGLCHEKAIFDGLGYLQ